jgi:hypothetical protein
MFRQDELINETAAKGFIMEKIFGRVRGRNFDLETSLRIIIIARK